MEYISLHIILFVSCWKNVFLWQFSSKIMQSLFPKPVWFKTIHFASGLHMTILLGKFLFIFNNRYKNKGETGWITKVTCFIGKFTYHRYRGIISTHISIKYNFQICFFCFWRQTHLPMYFIALCNEYRVLCHLLNDNRSPKGNYTRQFISENQNTLRSSKASLHSQCNSIFLFNFIFVQLYFCSLHSTVIFLVALRSMF